MFGLEQVSVEDNLFDLGGHSLMLVQMHGRLRVALKLEFPLMSLFTHPTIRSLARHFDQVHSQTFATAGVLRSRAQQQKHALTQLRSKRGEEVAMSEEQHEGIAIIGITGRFPAQATWRSSGQIWLQARRAFRFSVTKNSSSRAWTLPS